MSESSKDAFNRSTILNHSPRQEPKFSCHLCRDADTENMIRYTLCRRNFHARCVKSSSDLPKDTFKCRSCRKRSETAGGTSNPHGKGNNTPQTNEVVSIQVSKAKSKESSNGITSHIMNSQSQGPGSEVAGPSNDEEKIQPPVESNQKILHTVDQSQIQIPVSYQQNRNN